MSNAVRYWRDHPEGKKLTQQELADLIGIDRPTLSKIENNNIPIDPSQEMALKISRVLGVLITDIIKEQPKL